MSLKDQLTDFKGEVFDDEDILKKYSQDASIFEIKPQLVAAPADSQDIKNLISFVKKRPDLNLSITPRAAGTCMSGGAVGESIILDMTKHFNQILEVGSDFAIVQPGVYYRDFEKKTLQHDLILPCYTASREINTVGGMVGNNSAGEKTLSYGQTKDWVEKLQVVLSDGNEYIFEPLTIEELKKKLTQKDFEGAIYRQIANLLNENHHLIYRAKPQVSKNSAGYLIWDVWDGQKFDLSKLIIGSQGTLGIVTEIKFRLTHPKKHSKLLVIFMPDLEGLETIVNLVLAHQPESFESYDDQTLGVALKFLPEVIKVIKPKNLLSLAMSFLPEMWMTLWGGMPKLVLLAEFTGSTPQEVDLKCIKAKLDLKKFHLKTRITSTEEEAKKYWVLRRESFNLLRHHAGNRRTAPFIDDIIVQPSQLPKLLPRLKTILDDYKNLMIYTIAGHIGNGNFHIIPLVNLEDEKTLQAIPEISRRVFELVFEFKGSMDAEHNDGLIRGPFLEAMFGEDIYQLFKKIKNIFDPDNIFNPHKKVDATWEYSLAHITHQQVLPHSS